MHYNTKTKPPNVNRYKHTQSQVIERNKTSKTNTNTTSYVTSMKTFFCFCDSSNIGIADGELSHENRL